MSVEVHRHYLEHLRNLVMDLEKDEDEASQRIEEIRRQADQKIEEIQSQQAVNRRDLERYRLLVAQVAILAGETTDETGPTLEEPPVVLPHSAVTGENGRDEESSVRHADVAEIVLRKAGKPMRTKDIIKAMVEIGHPLKGDDSSRFNTIYKALQRRTPQVFEKRGKMGWALSSSGIDESKNANVEFEGAATAEAAKIALKKIGRPATAAQIHNELLSLGHTIHKNTKTATQLIYKAIQQSRDFRPIFGGRWELADGFPKVVH